MTTATATRRSVDDVPWWVGPLALVVTIASTILGLAVYAFWCYRRGTAEGAGLESDRAPYRNFRWRIAGWSLVLLASFALLVVATRLWIFVLPFPIITLAVCWHVPTLCYKQGLRVGASEAPGQVSFASWWILAAIIALISAIAIFLIAV